MKSSLEGYELTARLRSSFDEFESVILWDDCSDGICRSSVLNGERLVKSVKKGTKSNIKYC